MKMNIYCMLALITPLLQSCGGSDAVTDPSVCSYLSVQNNTNYALLVSYAPEYLTFPSPQAVEIGEEIAVYYLCDIGSNTELALKPSQILSEFSISLLDNEPKISVYEGVDDSDWQIVRTESSSVYFQFQVLDDDLVF